MKLHVLRMDILIVEKLFIKVYRLWVWLISLCDFFLVVVLKCFKKFFIKTFSRSIFWLYSFPSLRSSQIYSTRFPYRPVFHPFTASSSPPHLILLFYLPLYYFITPHSVSYIIETSFLQVVLYYLPNLCVYSDWNPHIWSLKANVHV